MLNFRREIPLARQVLKKRRRRFWRRADESDLHVAEEIRITPEGWIYLLILGFIGVGAVLRNVNLLILMSGLMIAPLLVNWRLGVLWLKTLTAERTLPEQLYARHLASVLWKCHNASNLSAWSVEIYDDVRLASGADLANAGDEESNLAAAVATTRRDTVTETGRRMPAIPWRRWLGRFLGVRTGIFQQFNARLSLPRITPHRSELASYRVYFTRRGHYHIGPALLTTRFPFGLISSRILISSEIGFWVAPALGHLTSEWNRRFRSTVLGSEATKRRRSLEEDEFFGLRPWRAGDGRKHIHWRSTAKFGQPIVKQHEQPENRDFAMVLDLQITARQLSGTSSDNHSAEQAACETLLSFATTTLVGLAPLVHGKFAMAICGQQNAICCSHNHRELLNQIMRQLAIAEPSTAPELVEALQSVSRFVANNTPIFVISTRPQPNFSDLTSTPPPDSRSNFQFLSELSLEWVEVTSPEFKRWFSERLPDGAASSEAPIHGLAQKWIDADVAS